MSEILLSRRAYPAGSIGIHAARAPKSGRVPVLAVAALLACTGAAFSQGAAQPPPPVEKAPAPSAAQPAPAERKPDPAAQTATPAPLVTTLDVKAGDRWVYDVYDDVTGDFKLTSIQTVSEVKDKSYSLLISGSLTVPQVSGAPTLSIYDANWNQLEDPLWRCRPGDPLIGVKLPLKVGEQWETRFDRTRVRPQMRMSATAVSKVVAWEHVKLHGGGEYDAFRIDVSERVKAFGALKKAELTATQWFAPAVNRFVKLQSETRIDGRLIAKSSYYLTDYTRRDDEE